MEGRRAHAAAREGHAEGHALRAAGEALALGLVAVSHGELLGAPSQIHLVGDTLGFFRISRLDPLPG